MQILLLFVSFYQIFLCSASYFFAVITSLRSDLVSWDCFGCRLAMTGECLAMTVARLDCHVVTLLAMTKKARNDGKFSCGDELQGCFLTLKDFRHNRLIDKVLVYHYNRILGNSFWY